MQKVKWIALQLDGEILDARQPCPEMKRVRSNLCKNRIEFFICCEPAASAVTTKAAPEPGTRIYRVHLFENHVLMVEKSYVQQQWTKYSIAHSDFQRIDPAVDDYEARAVIRLAIRSLYAVGLHLGQIILQAASPFRVKVRSISAEWDAEHKPGFLAEAEAWWLKEQGSWESPQIQLGADPEFALRHPDGKMALASDFMGISGVVGCDSTRYREDLALHQHPLVELRPAPSAEPDALFSRIVKALGAAAKKIVDKEVEWISGGCHSTATRQAAIYTSAGSDPIFPCCAAWMHTSRFRLS